jgi:hypothetical protein
VSATVRAIRQIVVLFAFVVDRLRRLPGSGPAGRVAPWVARIMLVAAIALLVVWASEKTPQRISMADLSAGRLSSMQDWLIVTGDVVETPALEDPGTYVYRMTDPTVPDVSLIVRSDTRLPTGRVTISGDLEGGREGIGITKPWVGSIRADASLAQEIPPPWGPIALVATALLVFLARRTRYPTFFRERPGPSASTGRRFAVELRQAPDEAAAVAIPASIVVGSGVGADASVQLEVAGREPESLRLHSEHTGAIAGELRTVGWAKPGIRMRRPMGDVTITFEATDQRDAVFHALHDDVRARIHRATRGTTGPVEGGAAR